MDKSRYYDLEELAEQYRTAPNSYVRAQIEHVINRIMRENNEVRQNREEMIRAIQNNDTRHVRYVQERLRYLDKQQTGGRETIKK